MDIYYKPGIIMPDKVKIYMPYADEPIKISKFKKKYKKFAKTFDGKYEDNCLNFYWELNKKTGELEFKDADFEDEVAGELGIKLEDCIDEIVKKLEESNSSTTSALSKKEIEEFKSHMEDIHEIHKKVSETTISHTD